jgi:hypothetical protein
VIKCFAFEVYVKEAPGHFINSIPNEDVENETCDRNVTRNIGEFSRILVDCIIGIS